MRFEYPRWVFSAAIIMILLIGLAWFLMLFAVLVGGSADLASGFGFISACCLGFVLLGIGLIRSHCATIEINPSEIVQRKGTRTKTIKYSETISVEHRFKVFKTLVLKTASDSMAINKNIVNYQQLWDALSAHLTDQARPDGESGLTITCNYMETYVSCMAFILPSLALVALGWYLFFAGQAGIITPLAFTAVLAPFIAMLADLVLKYPRYYSFQKDAILEKSWARERVYPVSQITKFSCGQRYVKVNAKIGSYCAHFVEIELNDTRKLSINQKDTDYPVEVLAEYLSKVYHLEDIKAIVTIDSSKVNTQKRQIQRAKKT